MPSITNSLRTAAALAVIAASAVTGATAASATTISALHGNYAHVRIYRDAKPAKQHRRRPKKRKAGIASAASANPGSGAPVKRPKPGTTTTTPAPTTPASTTPASTTPASTTPASTTPTGSTPQPIGIPGNWNLTLDSEFTGSTYDSSVWRTGVNTPNGGISPPEGTNEQDCYSPNNVTFPGDGTMHLALTDQPSSCNYWGIQQLSEPYTGAMLSTNPDDGRTSGGFQYTYGVLEARVYLPADGTKIADWPTVWTTSHDWPMTGEDDIVEGLGGQACYHWHYGASAAAAQQEGGCDTTLTPGWHTFSSDWQPGQVTYYYDGKEVGQLTSNITSAPQYIVLTNTTGDAAWNGPTAFDSMQVAYVRVWQTA